MPSKSKIKRRVLAALAVSFGCIAATPDPSYVGIQGLLLTGVHRDVSGSQYGLGAGPLLQVHAGGRRVAVHLEGIPVVSIPGTRPSVAYGQATPAIGIFNGDAEYALDRRSRWWIGLGETIYNQRTPLPAQQQVVSSRLSGVRYVLRYRRALSATHFVEAAVGAAPYLGGSDVYVFTGGISPAIVKPERASEIDASAAYGITHHHSQWLFGLRTLNFTARYPVTGLAADRNVGFGPAVEWRHLLR
jgi:hypothetical protein